MPIRYLADPDVVAIWAALYFHGREEAGLTVREIAEKASLSDIRVEVCLGSLEQLGLVEGSPGADETTDVAERRYKPSKKAALVNKDDVDS